MCILYTDCREYFYIKLLLYKCYLMFSLSRERREGGERLMPPVPGGGQHPLAGCERWDDCEITDDIWQSTQRGNWPQLHSLSFHLTGDQNSAGVAAGRCAVLVRGNNNIDNCQLWAQQPSSPLTHTRVRPELGRADHYEDGPKSQVKPLISVPGQGFKGNPGEWGLTS